MVFDKQTVEKFFQILFSSNWQPLQEFHLSHLYFIHLPSVLQTVKYILNIFPKTLSSVITTVFALSGSLGIELESLTHQGLFQINCKSSTTQPHLQCLGNKFISLPFLLSQVSKPCSIFQDVFSILVKAVVQSTFRYYECIYHSHGRPCWEMNPGSVRTLNYSLKYTESGSPNLLPRMMDVTGFPHDHIHI